jgi:hypothetical protein
MEEYSFLEQELRRIFLIYEPANLYALSTLYRRWPTECTPFSFLRWCMNGGTASIRRICDELYKLPLQDLSRLRNQLLYDLTPSKKQFVIAYDEVQVLNKYCRGIVVWKNHPTLESKLDDQGRLTDGTSAMCIPVRNIVEGGKMLFTGTEFKMRTLLSSASYFLAPDRSKPLQLNHLNPWADANIQELLNYYLVPELVKQCLPYTSKLCGRARIVSNFLSSLINISRSSNDFSEVASMCAH